MRKEAVLWSCFALLVLGSVSSAQDERPYIGVNLDPAPLPELLVKHLGLDPGQGIRISNIRKGSPADRAGLERDDLIVAFREKKVMDQEQFINAVRKADVGAEVSLEVIHLGQHKTLHLKLEPEPEAEVWKYTPEPVVTTWRPGKVFKIGPDGHEWLEIPFDKMPGFNVDVQKFFTEVYTYHHSSGGEDYTVTIEGNPRDEDSAVIVRVDGTEHRATVGKLDTLPEKYRESAEKSVEDARRTAKFKEEFRGRLRMPEPPRPDVYRKYFEALPRLDMDRLSEQKDRALERLQEQMERLQQQMREMEERNREMLDKLLEKKESKKNTGEEPRKSAPSESEQKQTI